VRFDAYLRARAPRAMPPQAPAGQPQQQQAPGAKAGGAAAGARAAAKPAAAQADASGAAAAGELDTIYEWYPFLDAAAGMAVPLGVSTDADAIVPWRRWAPPAWKYPDVEVLDFSNLLVPTMDSTRAIAVLDHLHRRGKPVLLVGGPGTAKTTTALMYFGAFDPAKRLLKRINFSSATTPGIFQRTVEAELDKRGGKSFGPPGGKHMTVFIDDISMPLINTWGDQPTNEIVRQIIESGGVYFLDTDKRGDFKICEDLQYVAAMNQPVGGRNDMPSRLKRQFFAYNLVLPSLGSIDELYGQMLRGRFRAAEFKPSVLEVASRLTAATIELWRQVKARMLPTPSKFHYIFNMRELSRVFQGVLFTPKESVKSGGQQAPSADQGLTLLKLWRHECARVFQDKLTNNGDKRWYSSAMDRVVASKFGPEAAAATSDDGLFCDFMRDDQYDEEEVLIAEAPKIYEDGGSLATVRARVTRYLERHNEESPARKLELVMFDDALRHLVRISRILAMPRGSALLVGVGGSGKQSLTRLAAYIARSKLFQITLTKAYNSTAFMDDLKIILEYTGHQRKSATFLFTDAEIKDENFLEFLNSILMTGEVAGLFAKDEMLAMSADLRPAFIAARPGVVDSPDNLKQFFIDCARDNLHLVLCMSPVNPKFPERARKFPGLVSGTTIDWFLPWPEEALISVSRGFLADYALEADDAVKEQLIVHMGQVHGIVVEVCEEYYASNRRHVYQTPKSFLAFLRNYKALYATKLAEVKVKEERVNMGLRKLVKGAEDVEAMKVVLQQETVKLNKANEETSRMLGSLEISSLEAEREATAVAAIKADCIAEAARIKAERDACHADLARAQPFVEEAAVAIASIKPQHIQEVRALKGEYAL
jgi:dynein heavy chain